MRVFSGPYFLTYAFLGLAASALAAETTRECRGEGDARICATITTHDDNSMVVKTSDSEGNTYEIRSWSDAKGTHSVDSRGNRCSITRSGAIIGCGQ